MFLDLRAQLPDLLLIIVETVAEVLLHVADFGLLGEQVEQVFDLEHVVLPDDSQGLLHLDRLLFGGRALRLIAEEMLREYKPPRVCQYG